MSEAATFEGSQYEQKEMHTAVHKRVTSKAALYIAGKVWTMSTMKSSETF